MINLQIQKVLSGVGLWTRDLSVLTNAASMFTCLFTSTCTSYRPGPRGRVRPSVHEQSPAVVTTQRHRRTVGTRHWAVGNLPYITTRHDCLVCPFPSLLSLLPTPSLPTPSPYYYCLLLLDFRLCRSVRCKTSIYLKQFRHKKGDQKYIYSLSYDDFEKYQNVFKIFECKCLTIEKTCTSCRNFLQVWSLEP